MGSEKAPYAEPHFIFGAHQSTDTYDFGSRIDAWVSHLGSPFVLVVKVSSLNKMRIHLLQDSEPVPVKRFAQVECTHLPDAEGRLLRLYK